MREPIRARSGQIERYDCEYKRNGTANLFIVLDVNRPWRKVKVTDSRTAIDFAICMRELADVDSSALASLVATRKNLPYDPLNDFTHIVQIFSYPSVLVCHASEPYSTVQELVEYAKQNPGKVTNGSAGPGSGNHFMIELFNSMANVQITHVPYRGSSQALIDTIAGTTSCTFDGSSKPHVDSGKVKALAVTGLVRDPRSPNVPTLDESGLRGFNIVTWQGLAAPRGTPEPIVRKLNQAVNEILQEHAVQAKAAELSLIVGGGTPERLTAIIRDDIARYRKIARDSDLKFD